MTKPLNLAEAFVEEQARVRELLQAYHEIGPAGKFGAIMLEQTLRQADQAAMGGDIVEMIQSYKALKECE